MVALEITFRSADHTASAVLFPGYGFHITGNHPVIFFYFEYPCFYAPVQSQELVMELLQIITDRKQNDDQENRMQEIKVIIAQIWIQYRLLLFRLFRF
jgi:hypothetical protein